MAEQPLIYDNPTKAFLNVSGLLTNHYRVFFDALPDLTFFAQTVTIPGVGSPSVPRGTPFSVIKETGDHVAFHALKVSFMVDAQALAYISLYGWIKGYGFPTSYEDLQSFRELREKQIPRLAHPQAREIQKTNLSVKVLDPESDSILLEWRFVDAFPTFLGEIKLTSTEQQPNVLTCDVAFDYTTFDLWR